MNDLQAIDFENVLLISVDCLREDYFDEALAADSVDALGRLARTGIRFDNACTVANATDPSLTSLMTATYPQTHGVLENGWGLDADRPVLADLLSTAGYETFGVVSVDHLSHEHSGLGRGFDAYHSGRGYDTLYPILSRIYDTKTFNRVFGAIKNVGTERYNVKNLLRDLGLIRLHCRTGASVNADTIAELDRSDGPFFGWIHYFDMHEPRNFDRSLLADHDEYTASMHTVDQCIGDVLSALESRGLLDSTLIVLVADHGENLGDHGYSGHGRTLYDEEVRVPLVFAHPDIEPETVSEQVRTIDLAPTILELLGVTPPDAFEGRSLLRETNGSIPGDRDVFLTAYPEFTEAVGLRAGGYKLIRQDGTYEFYDLMNDPDEQTNLFDTADGPPSTLVERLEQWAADSDATQSQDVSDETRAMLSDLGYVE